LAESPCSKLRGPRWLLRFNEKPIFGELKKLRMDLEVMREGMADGYKRQESQVLPSVPILTISISNQNFAIKGRNDNVQTSWFVTTFNLSTAFSSA
jgi:hypothetical protein